MAIARVGLAKKMRTKTKHFEAVKVSKSTDRFPFNNGRRRGAVYCAHQKGGKVVESVTTAGSFAGERNVGLDCWSRLRWAHCRARGPRCQAILIAGIDHNALTTEKQSAQLETDTGRRSLARKRINFRRCAALFTGVSRKSTTWVARPRPTTWD